jgi:hypothetical protein
MLKRLLKILHEIGAVGVMGSFAACLVLVLKGPTQPLVAYAAVGQAIAAITQWLLLPSLVLVLLSGLLAIAATSAFQNAAWAWVKALLGLSLFEGTLVTINANARRAAELAALAASGQGDAAQLAQTLRTQCGALWLLLALSLVNIVLAVWRPRLYRISPERTWDKG